MRVRLGLALPAQAGARSALVFCFGGEAAIRR